MTAHGARRTGRQAVRLDERLAGAVAVVSGVVAALSDVNPTGHEVVSRVLVGLLVAAVTWAAASAPWWVLAGASGIAAIVAFDPLLTAVGIVGFVIGLWVGVRRRNLGVPRALVAAIALNVLVQSEIDGFHGASAVIAVTTAAVLFVLGIRRRRSQTRRLAWGLAGGFLCLGLFAIIGFGLTATQARALLVDGQRLAREGIAQLGRGDFEAAAASFSSAGDSFTRASRHLDRPWAVPAQLVPVVAQNADAVDDLAVTAGRVSSTVGDALAQIELEQLRVQDGQIDLDALRGIVEPLESVQASIAELETVIDGIDSPWLVGPIEDRLDGLTTEIEENAERLDNAVAAARLAPQLLGADGPRYYFIMFTTPAEARGLGGFMGNYAEVEAVDGRLSVTRFGRTSDLNRGSPDPDGRVITGPADWLAQWGRFTVREPATGVTGVVPWQNITMSPDFPAVAEVVSQLYPQSGGREIDGVFAIDPYVLAELLEFTGPVTIEATNQELNANNVVDFLLKDQYLIEDTPDRIDLLEQVSEVTIGRVLSGGLPDPVQLARRLGPLVEEGRLVGWSADATEQALFGQVGMDGAQPTLDGGDGVALVVNNAAANKLDVYLERSVAYDATLDPATGDVVGTIEVTLTNTAPPSGLPEYVAGNSVGAPAATNVALVSVYTALEVIEVQRDGAPLSVEPGRDGAWNTVRFPLRVTAGTSVTFLVRVEGSIDPAAVAESGVYPLTRRVQPLVVPEQQRISVETTDGTPLLQLPAP